MRARVAFLLAFWAASAVTALAEPVKAPSVLGHWQGELLQQGQLLQIEFDFTSAGDETHVRFSSDRWRVMDYPIGNATVHDARVSFSIESDPAMDGTIAGDTLRGTFHGDSGAGVFTLHRVPPRPLPYRAIEVAFRNGATTLHGTLSIPRTPGRHPAVVLVHGSGAELRWGTNRYIADRLARAGIAALVYDKRGTGDSTGDWRTASYEDLARDALAGVDLMAGRPEVDRHRIGILGHSEGGIIAPIAEGLAPAKVAFLVVEDTVIGRIRDQDLFRVTRDIESQPWSAADKSAALALYSLFLDVASGDKPYSEYEHAASLASGDAWFHYLGLPARDHWLWNWYRARGDFDTLTVWQNVHAPVFVLYGQSDAIVPVDESIRRLSDTLDQTGSQYAVFIVPRAEHNLTIHPQANEAFFWWRQAPGVINAISGWINSIQTRS